MSKATKALTQRLRGSVRKRSSSHGGRPMIGMRIGHRFQVPTRPTMVHLIPEEHIGYDGSTIPYFEYVEHFTKTRSNSGFVCSREWKEDHAGKLGGKGNCIGCYELDIPEGSWDKGRNAVKDVSNRRMASFLLLHLADYHEVQACDARGNPLSYDEDSKYHHKGDPILRRALCTGRGCKECKARNPKVFGKLLHWSVGSGHLQAISAFADDLELKCRSCHGRLEPVMFTCDECGQIVLDLSDPNCDLTDDDVLSVTSQPMRCKECRHLDYVNPVFECDTCKDPKPTSLFDVSFAIKKTTDNIPQLFFADSRVEDIDELPEEVLEMLPVDKEGEPRNILHRIFSSDDFKRQTDVLKVRNPFGDGGPDTERYDDRDKSKDDRRDDMPR